MNIMADKAHYESHLEAYIVQKLQAQGWVIGQSKNYHTEYALYPEDLITWIQATQPEKWEKLQALNGSNTEWVVVIPLKCFERRCYITK
jgi:type I restriction enzyme, R subunit